MKKHIYLLVFIACMQFIEAQVIYEPFNSAKLGETREIKIQLPRGYDANPDKKYPIIMVFDGDYMFEAVAGNVDYYAFWEDMPDVIVVGVNQIDSREADMYYSEQNSLLIETGAAFFEFVGMELIPHLEKTYRTENFRVAVGHGETANFINYYLLKDDPLFKAYIVISPDLAPEMTSYIPERLTKFQTKIFYYLAT
ncbi:MAG TPA: alpha/beta hydrolase-fold protein, partial [Xanthomarina sp.]|nr:alpha/beta hydrolase-fold protein [Xanthomarina sp.]